MALDRSRPLIIAQCFSAGGNEQPTGKSPVRDERTWLQHIDGSSVPIGTPSFCIRIPTAKALGYFRGKENRSSRELPELDVLELRPAPTGRRSAASLPHASLTPALLIAVMLHSLVKR